MNEISSHYEASIVFIDTTTFVFSYSSDRTTIAPDSSRLSCIFALPCYELQNTPLSPSAAPIRMLSHDAAQQKYKAGEKGRANHAMQDVNKVLVGLDVAVKCRSHPTGIDS